MLVKISTISRRIFSKITLNFRSFFLRFRSFRFFFLKIFFFGALISAFLILFWLFFPALSFCTSLFKQKVCLPYGEYLLFFLNFPGYLIAGFFLPTLAYLPFLPSFMVVFLISAFFFYILGFFIEAIAARKKIKIKFSITALTFSLFLFFLFFALILYFSLT